MKMLFLSNVNYISYHCFLSYGESYHNDSTKCSTKKALYKIDTDFTNIIDEEKRLLIEELIVS